MNLQPLGYEPNELPIAPPRDVVSIIYDNFLGNANGGIV